MILVRGGWTNSKLTYETEGMTIKVLPSPDGDLLKSVVDVSGVPPERLSFGPVRTLPCVLDMGIEFNLDLDDKVDVVGFSVSVKCVGGDDDAFEDSLGRYWELRSGKRGGIGERIIGCLRLVPEEGFLLTEAPDAPDSRTWKLTRD